MWPHRRLLSRLTTVASVILLAGCSAKDIERDDEGPVGSVEGWILDNTLRPVPDAVVRIEGMAAVAVGEDGHYRLEASWARAHLMLIAEAPGFLPSSQVIQPGSHAHRFQVNFTLSRLPTDAWTDTQSFAGVIACGFMVQIGHSHGGGSPDDDSHFSCPVVAGEAKQDIPFIPERDPDDMVIEVFWKPAISTARYITVILYDDEGELVQFEEGDSPLRLEVGQAHVKQRFQDGRSGTIELRPGIADDDPPGEVYYSLHVDQSFDVYATTSHGKRLPVGWSING